MYGSAGSPIDESKATTRPKLILSDAQIERILHLLRGQRSYDLTSKAGLVRLIKDVITRLPK